MISVERIMREIEDDLRRERRARLIARGGPGEYRDAEIFAAVEELLRRAVDGRNHDAVLLPELLADDEEWKLRQHLQFSSHRPFVGPLVVFFKRRIVLPLTRWLYEYNLENFRRQERLNVILFACVEELAIENARLKQMVESRAGRSPERREEQA